MWLRRKGSQVHREHPGRAEPDDCHNTGREQQEEELKHSYLVSVTPASKNPVKVEKKGKRSQQWQKKKKDEKKSALRKERPNLQGEGGSTAPELVKNHCAENEKQRIRRRRQRISREVVLRKALRQTRRPSIPKPHPQYNNDDQEEALLQMLEAKAKIDRKKTNRSNRYERDDEDSDDSDGAIEDLWNLFPRFRPPPSRAEKEILAQSFLAKLHAFQDIKSKQKTVEERIEKVFLCSATVDVTSQNRPDFSTNFPKETTLGSLDNEKSVFEVNSDDDSEREDNGSISSFQRPPILKKYRCESLLRCPYCIGKGCWCPFHSRSKGNAYSTLKRFPPRDVALPEPDFNEDDKDSNVLGSLSASMGPPLPQSRTVKTKEIEDASGGLAQDHDGEFLSFNQFREQVRKEDRL